MDHQQLSKLRLQAASLWQKLRTWATRTPAKAWLILGLFLVAAILVAVHTAINAQDSSLHLRVQHSFHSAQLSVWSDGSLIYSGTLTGYSKKKFGILPDSVQGSLSRIIPISSGRHKIRVQIEPDDGSAQEEITTADFPKNAEQDLSISARRSGLSLTWPGTSDSAPEAETTAPSWFSRYAASLFLTIAGSIVSALTGYAIRELPGHLRPRQSEAEAPKA